MWGNWEERRDERTDSRPNFPNILRANESVVSTSYLRSYGLNRVAAFVSRVPLMALPPEQARNLVALMRARLIRPATGRYSDKGGQVDDVVDNTIRFKTMRFSSKKDSSSALFPPFFGGKNRLKRRFFNRRRNGRRSGASTFFSGGYKKS
jgi:hypothetical protein